MEKKSQCNDPLINYYVCGNHFWGNLKFTFNLHGINGQLIIVVLILSSNAATPKNGQKLHAGIKGTRTCSFWTMTASTMNSYLIGRFLLLAISLALGQAAPTSYYHHPNNHVAHNELSAKLAYYNQMANSKGLDHEVTDDEEELRYFLDEVIALNHEVTDDEEQYVLDEVIAPRQGNERQHILPFKFHNHQALDKINGLTVAKEEATGRLGDAARYFADALSKWKSHSDNLQPGDVIRILAKLLDEKCEHPEAGDDFRHFATILDGIQRASELLGFSHEGKDASDFDYVNFFQTLADALDGLHGDGDFQQQDFVQILKTIVRKIGGKNEGSDEILGFIDIAFKLFNIVFESGPLANPTSNTNEGIVLHTGIADEGDLGTMVLCTMSDLFG